MRRNPSNRIRPDRRVFTIALLLLAAAGGVVGAEDPRDDDPASDVRPTADAAEEDAAQDRADSPGGGSDGDAADRWDARIAVKAELREATSAPLGSSSTVLDPAQAGSTPSNLTDLVVEAPGVSQNGQGGHFQVFSVRGVSRHRVMNLVSGMRVFSERRAGASVSFVDPLLMDSVEVQRGPATTLHGSGALGGVVQVFPRGFRGWHAQTGYDSSGDENYQVFGFGTGPWSMGFARRDAGDARAPDGTRLNSHFTQYSATISRSWGHGPRRYALLFIPTLAEDVGKANTDYPERTTEYPLERHQMLQLSVDAEGGWRLNGWLHAHDLETAVDDLSAPSSQVDNESLDYGIRWEREGQLSDGVSLRGGLQSVGRHDVSAEETGQAPSLDDAREIEAGAFATVRWSRPAADFEVGGRLSWQDQENDGFADEDSTAVNGFVGATRRFGDRVELRGSISSGLRFPNLSERFYTGTTGAGQIVGNPDLDSERSLNAQVSARWLGRKALVSAAIFRNEIDDYIERVEIAEDLLTFRNLTSGTLQGVELQTIVLPTERWNVTIGGHAVRGRDDDDRPLADVSPYLAYVELGHRTGAWTFETRLTHRVAKTDPGSAEKRLPAADELHATVGYRLAESWSLAVTGSNLLDEEYFLAADRRAPLAPERSVGIRFVRTAR
jgi:iron complex outermembrane receptor protein